MTDPELADATYIEPITPEVVAKIIAKERPDALLPTMGGQTALNTALSLRRMGVLERYNVEMIGADAARHRQGRGPRAVSRGDAEDRAGNAEIDAGQRHRRQGRRPQDARGRARRAEGRRRPPISTPRSTRWKRSGTSARATASSAISSHAMAIAAQALDHVGLPAIIRPSFTHGRHRRRHRLQPRRILRDRRRPASTPRRPPKC